MEHQTALNEIEHARRRVTTGPVPAWATLSPFDEGWRAEGGVSYSLLLSDEQHYAEEKAVFIRKAYRVETLQAVMEASQWKFDFDPATQHLVLHTLAVRRAGTTIEHGPDKFRFLQRETSLEAFSIDGRISLLVLLEDVRVGDIIEMALTLTTESRLFADHFSRLAFPASLIPTRLWRWSVRFAPGRAMRWKCGEEPLKPTVRELPGGGTEWQWSMEDVKPEAAEPGTPAWSLPTHWLQACDFASWSEVSSAVLARWEEDFAEPEVRALAERIAAEAPTTAARIERALTIVQDEIRYLSVNIELGGQIPTAPGSVWLRRYGDCKDKSFLLVHLLRWLGVPARPVLVHAGLAGSVGEMLPMPAFDHVVVEFELDGERRWVDATMALQGGDAHHRYVQSFGLGLPIGPGVEALEEQPLLRKAGHLTVHERFGIDEAAGLSRMVAIFRGNGAQADELRGRVMMRGAEAFGEERMHFYRQYFPGALVVGKVEWQDNREVNEFRVGIQFSLPMTGALSPDAGLSTFSYAAHLIRAQLPVPATDRRRTPLRLAEGMKYDHLIEMTNTRLTSHASRNFNVRHRTFDFSGLCENRSTGHLLHFSLTVLKDHVRAREVTSFLAKLDEVWRATTVQLVVARSIKTSVAPRRGATLLPVQKPATTPALEPAPAGPPLAAEPVSALLSPAMELTPERRGTARSLEGTPAPAEPVKVPDLLPRRSHSRALESMEESLAEDGDEEPRRRRRRKSSRDRKKKPIKTVTIVLLIVLGSVGLVMLLFWMQKK